MDAAISLSRGPLRPGPPVSLLRKHLPCLGSLACGCPSRPSPCQALWCLPSAPCSAGARTTCQAGQGGFSYKQPLELEPLQTVAPASLQHTSVLEPENASLKNSSASSFPLISSPNDALKCSLPDPRPLPGPGRDRERLGFGFELGGLCPFLLG